MKFDINKTKSIRFRGIKYTPYTDLDVKESAFHRVSKNQIIVLLSIIALGIIGFYLNWHISITVIIAVLTCIYFADLLFNFFLIWRSFTKPPEIVVTNKEIQAVKDDYWPSYSIFCPLYKEGNVLSQLVNALSKLDYPRDKLQVLFILEEDDKNTFQRVKSLTLPKYFEIIKVLSTLPKTKPKALNYALKYAKGEYATIYDAEDIPDPLQLKKAILAFRRNDPSLVCVQAKLNFYNPKQNILTRIFCAEYSLWFDLVLTGLQSFNAPIPLGGTSNHFRLYDVKKLNGWDAFNVTEDCDLGMRFAKNNFRTAMINSVTYEEASSTLPVWFHQRTRWIKGYIQTYFVHMRNPLGFFKKNKRHHLLSFQLVVGGKVMSMFINPLMWILTITYFSLRPIIGTFIDSFFPTPVLYMAVFSLVFGNFLYLYYYMIGCAKRKHEELIKYVYLVPFYWILISTAAWWAVYQIIRRPHHWAKTSHGFHLLQTKEKTLVTAPYPRIVPSFSVNKNLSRYALLTVVIFWLYYFVLYILRIPLERYSYLSIARYALADSIIIFGIFYIKGKKIFFRQNLEDFLKVFSPNPKDINSFQKKKILIFNWRDIRHKFAGGAEVYIHEMAKRWVTAGCHVTVFCGNDGTCLPEEILDGVQIFRRGGFYFVYVWAFIYYLFKFRGKFDVIIDSQNGIPFYTPLYVKEPVYCLMHHVHQEVFTKSLALPLAAIARVMEKNLMPVIYKKIKFITVSKSTKSEMQKLDIGKAGIAIIHGGVDIKKFKPAKKSVIPTVLYLGRLKDYKSLPVLIRAAEKIVHNLPRVKFIIAGDGEEKDRLLRMRDEFGLKNKIQFLGYVGEKEKVRLMQKAWLFVNPSFMEGWGITTIEANACGTPIVASDVPGLRDSVENPHTGYLISYGQIDEFATSIRHLLMRHTLREKMSQKAILWAKRYDWDIMAQKCLNIIL